MKTKTLKYANQCKNIILHYLCYFFFVEFIFYCAEYCGELQNTKQKCPLPELHAIATYILYLLVQVYQFPRKNVIKNN